MLSINEQVSNDVMQLAMGPLMPVKRFGAYCINGYKFHTSKYEAKRATQNNGVVATFTQPCFSSYRDVNPTQGLLCYYGQLEDIIEISYGNEREVNFVMFDVRWCKSSPNKDRYGFQTVNLANKIYDDERFMFASQAQQCFYVKDPNVNDTWVVLRKPPWATFEGILLDSTTDEDMETEDPAILKETCEDYPHEQNVELSDTVSIREDAPSV